MSKQAWFSLPILATLFMALLGCPAAEKKETPAPQGASAAAAKAPSEGTAAKPAVTDDQSDGEVERTRSAEPAAAEPADRRQSPSEPNIEVAAQRNAPSGKRRDGASPGKEPKQIATKPAAKESAGDDEDDPVKKNGEIFVGWPKPKLAIVITSEQLGYIEPCGCAGLENQKGGLRRRHTFLKLLAARGWPVAALDNGGLIRRFGRQAEIKFEKTVEGLKIMDYRAIGFGADDLKLPAGSVVASVTNIDAFVSANVGLFGMLGEEGAFTPRFRVIDIDGTKLGVTSVFGEALQKEIHNDEIKFENPEVAIRQILPELKQAKCDYLVLLSYASPEESKVLAEQFPEFNAVVTAGGYDEPPFEPATVEKSKNLLIEVGHKGMYAIVLGLFDDQEQPWRYQRVPLDHRFKDSAQMDELMVNYQDQLRELGWEGLGLRPANHPRGTFAGSKACAECHEAESDIWRDTPHAHATETLARVKPPRQFDPECISCHATGWNPQEFFPYASGYDSLKTTPFLAGNGCENCHGPGADHIAAEKGDDEEKQIRFRAAMKLSLASKDDEESVRRSCMECHDIDNSPDFDFKEYWPKVAH